LSVISADARVQPHRSEARPQDFVRLLEEMKAGERVAAGGCFEPRAAARETSSTRTRMSAFSATRARFRSADSSARTPEGLCGLERTTRRVFGFKAAAIRTGSRA